MQAVEEERVVVGHQPDQLVQRLADAVAAGLHAQQDRLVGGGGHRESGERCDLVDGSGAALAERVEEPDADPARIVRGYRCYGRR